MPEYPDLTVYVEALEARILGEPLEKLRIQSPSLLRSVQPKPDAVEGQAVRGVSRMGKRLVFHFDDELFLVLHLMIAGRLQWKKRGVAIPRKRAHAAFDFPNGSLLLTEASTKKRASLHVVKGERALAEHDPGGLEVFRATPARFREALERERHTLKRSLTDPHLFSGIGNAYSDEILHTARLSPFASSKTLKADQVATLYDAMRGVLTDATGRLEGQAVARLKSEKRTGLRVHARTGLPCPVCGDIVREVSFADRSFQYCATCQTGGKVLADRRMSRLLK